MGGKLAEAYVEIASRTKGFDDGMKTSEAGLKGFVDRSNSLLGAIGIGIGAAGAVTFFKNAVMSAADLGETMSKVQQVFGSSSASVTKMSETMADRFGSVRQVTLDAAANFGLVAQAAGLTNEKSAELSVTMTRLADDASSFFNVPLDVALEKIRSGMIGEAEPLRQFGVLLSEDAVKAKALEMGLAGLNNELTDGAKVLARVAIIQTSMAKAAGDHERTIDSLTNETRGLSGAWTNMQTTIGESIIGTGVTGIVGGLSRGGTFMKKLSEQVGVGGALSLSAAALFERTMPFMEGDKYQQAMINYVTQGIVGPEAYMKKPASHGAKIPDEEEWAKIDKMVEADKAAKLAREKQAVYSEIFKGPGSETVGAVGGFGGMGIVGTMQKSAIDSMIDQARMTKGKSPETQEQLDKLKDIRDALFAIRDKGANLNDPVLNFFRAGGGTSKAVGPE